MTNRQAGISVLLTAAYGFASAKVPPVTETLSAKRPSSITSTVAPPGYESNEILELMDAANGKYLYPDLSPGDDGCRNGKSNERFAHALALPAHHMQETCLSSELTMQYGGLRKQLLPLPFVRAWKGCFMSLAGRNWESASPMP
jgi:hypothetical protein